ncbi:MAG: exonuclease domain-containing protein, partial [Bacteroidota bacterium]
MFRKLNVRKRYHNKDYPTFIQDYLDLFQENHKKKDFLQTRFVVFDTETTGLNCKKDKVISIAGVGLVNMEIKVEDSLELLVKNASSGSSESIIVHRILKQELLDGLSEVEALERFLK